nr:MAG TPA: hypothetical protein [Bacteriophage sp.]DAK37909.1 MAG TPA: hypothetical protein [Caudoviricetes sp.]DAO44581.1 MAG TPA: hypothetical protein [Caudoviricetes sp.]DAS78764.1 MAG TPA: hypothetical protein [Caudoviricetes sp.]
MSKRWRDVFHHYFSMFFMRRYSHRNFSLGQCIKPI